MTEKKFPGHALVSMSSFIQIDMFMHLHDLPHVLRKNTWRITIIELLSFSYKFNAIQVCAIPGNSGC